MVLYRKCRSYPCVNAWWRNTIHLLSRSTSRCLKCQVHRCSEFETSVQLLGPWPCAMRGSSGAKAVKMIWRWSIKVSLHLSHSRAAASQQSEASEVITNKRRQGTPTPGSCSEGVSPLLRSRWNVSSRLWCRPNGQMSCGAARTPSGAWAWASEKVSGNGWGHGWLRSHNVGTKFYGSGALADGKR